MMLIRYIFLLFTTCPLGVSPCYGQKQPSSAVVTKDFVSTLTPQARADYDAIRPLLKAANSGDIEAQKKIAARIHQSKKAQILGDLLNNDLSFFARDVYRTLFSRKTFIDAAEMCDPKAQFALAYLEYAEKGPTNPLSEEAIYWLKTSANAGINLAAFHLGMLYLIGAKEQRNYASALKWFASAAGKGYLRISKQLLGETYKIEETTEDEALFKD